ncbi:MAG: GatB/YqeY domain-containing protein, partial [Chloroflexi bacterium]
MSDLQFQISETTKVAMKARDKRRVAALRLILAEIKQLEVDERRELTDEDVLEILIRL